ncbi:26S proteasome non-ATPase regulatory subunit 5 [Plakobranchus ocellatus]|uniref:26S proteasome non-ATPase regulatory subunit 5 n=1 Tax=Plakobranchus ocellatus TaxID=259542 RepID=A0AAV4DZW5_9GAST|nr:26S proteasome non-ATPase regulatory subunit 5 [Plakobranchus ocellatus]
MAAPEVTIAALVDRLAQINLENITEALEELKIAITALPPSSLRTSLPHLSIGNVFQCLNTQNRTQQRLCGEVLNHLLSSLSAPAVLEHFNNQLVTWIKLPDDSMKALCLSQLSRISKDAPEDFSGHEDLVLAVVEQLSSDALDVGPPAATVITNIGQDPNGLHVIFKEAMLRQFATAMEKNSVTRFRVYQIATDLSRQNSEALTSCVESGLLQQLVNEVARDDDILVQLNAIELLSDLAMTQHGLQFLDQHGIVGKLETMMAELGQNPMAGLILPGLIKFFGGLAKNHPKEVLFKFDHFVRLVLSNVGENDPNLKPVSIDTVGLIASTPEGKLALEKLGNPWLECVQTLGRILKTGLSEIKTRVLQAMANICHLQAEHQTSELLVLTERWFVTSTPDAFTCVWSTAQQPFPDLRLPALHVLQTVAALPWGQKMMNATPGFREYVLDRSTEHSKEGKESKYELVCALANSPTAAEIFGQPYLVQLKEYVNQGAFFVMAQSEVAMEGDG